MNYATHKAGGALFALTGFAILSKHLNSDIEPWLSLLLLYPASSFGSTFPDLDHNWSSVKEHTPVNFLMHKIIHLTKPHHRSWQTHCLFFNLLAIVVLFLVLTTVYLHKWFSPVSINILTILTVGFSLGLLSHLFLDMLTRAGIWLLPGVKFRLVPNTEFFSTGSIYESICRGVLYVLDALLIIWILNPFNLQSLF